MTPDLLQERAYAESGDPWRLFATCVLLNATPGRRVEPLLPFLWRVAPHARFLASESCDVIARVTDLVRPLGLVRHRMKALVEMTDDYSVLYASEVRPVLEARGLAALGPRFLRRDGSPWIRWVGRYAWESHELFVMKRPLLALPGDAALRRRSEELGLTTAKEDL